MLAHLEIGTVVLALHLFVRRPARFGVGAILAGVVARLSVHAWYLHHLKGPTTARAGYALAYWWTGVRLNALKPVTLVLMAFNWFWIAVIFAGSRGLLERRDLVGLGLAIGISGITVDTTRVATLVALPVIFSLSERIVADTAWRSVRSWVPWAILAFFAVGALCIAKPEDW